MAKFKIMKKTSKTDAAAQVVDDDVAAMDIDGDESAIEKQANATFNDEEDEALIQGTC